ncbi:MAG: glycosyltransferase family 2 protein [bacterium]
MSTPLVTIGLPVYNGEKYLAQALASLLAQSFTDFELIISDNGSSDGTGAICEAFEKQDKRIRCFRQPNNRESLWNFNFVLEQAQGKYFMWAAHDDLWDKDWIAALLRNFKDGASISFGHVVNIDEVGKTVRTYRTFDFSGNRLLRMVRFYMAEERNGKANIIYGLHRTDMVKKLAFREYNNCSFGRDMHFVFDCLQHGNVRTDPSVFLYKRIPAEARRPCSPGRLISSGFLLNRLKFHITYPFVASRGIDKLILLLLFPLRYVKALIFNAGLIASRVVSRIYQGDTSL